MAKAIFFDVDGTLFRVSCRVPQSTVRAIEACAKNGHIILLCTGRNQSMIPEEVRALPLSGMVGGCGTYVALKDRILTDAYVEGEDCKRIVAALYKYCCPFYIENSDYFYYDPDYITDSFLGPVASMNKNYPAYVRHMDSFPNRIAKITAYPEKREYVPDLIRELSPWFDVITHPEYDYIEITLKGYSKGTGVQQLIDALGLKREDTYGFGDSRNDIPMLETVGHGIVMGDAPDELKKCYQATDSMFADGIEKGLKKAGLI